MTGQPHPEFGVATDYWIAKAVLAAKPSRSSGLVSTPARRIAEIGSPIGNKVPNSGLFLLARISATGVTAKGLVFRLI
jgi:hypothetical protein